jgi:CDP-archaeol synthase
MNDLEQALRVLLMLACANTAPLVAKRCLPSHGSMRLDGGLRFFDGQPLLGASKTVRGLLAAVLATALAAPLLGWPMAIGAALGALAMAGDALSSFVKRRLRIAPSGRATGLDQLPEALLPLAVLHAPLGLGAWQVIAIALVFFLLEMPLARLSHRIGLRDEPY